MRKNYRIVGLHCRECFDRIIKELKEKLPADALDFHPTEQSIEIPPESFNEAKIIAAKHHTYLVEERKFSQSQKEAHGYHEDSHHSHAHFEEDASVRHIGIAFFLNLFFSIAEFIFGRIFNSHAIMADAVHDLGDALAIGVSLGLQKISKKEGDFRYSDGYGRFSLLGALFTGLVLLFGSTMIIFTSIPKLLEPQPVNYNGMFVMGIIAVVINSFAAYLMMRGASKNEKMLSLHMLEDLLGWLAIIVLSIILRFREWYILDPILSILISSFILYNVVPELFKTFQVFMDKTPGDVDLKALREKILRIDHVHGISNVHSHSIDGQDHVFSANLFIDTKDPEEGERAKDEVKVLLAGEGFSHVILELTIDSQGIVKE